VRLADMAEEMKLDRLTELLAREARLGSASPDVLHRHGQNYWLFDPLRSIALLPLSQSDIGRSQELAAASP
jgi:hypothetical protein